MGKKNKEAAAAQPSIDLTQILKDRRGKEMLQQDGDVISKLSLRDAIFNIIDTPQETDAAMSTSDKIKLDRIARKCEEADEVVLTKSEATNLLNRSKFNALLTGRLVEILDPGQLED